ncbi:MULTISPECIES: hypothetical protein [unclassified Variovorax]|nr:MULTISPECIES: hypothetical protein [unclassified Variovorax]RSZ38278.1 hypothetical protein EJO70_19275 [Variovorax sp. 553]RSZ39270.1 hypothetical protein EJO71_19975 [Variovorax sp. 679]
MSLVSRTLRAGMALAFAALLVGCAHPINVGTDAAPQRVEATLVQKKVAYTMTDAQRAMQAVTPGGGGDRISYYPYRDLEKSIRDALRAVYQDVVVIKSAADANAVQASGAALVFTPEIKTDSGSPSPFTWPPTYFTTEVSCVVTDPAGVEVTRVKASGRGEAEFSEFKGEFGLAAKRAATKMATELSSELRRNEKLR